MACSGLCYGFKIGFDQTAWRGYYLGRKMCITCNNVWIETDSIYCPCCGRKLRTRPHRHRTVNVSVRDKKNTVRIN